MNTMSHKGYTARVEYDERDNIFVGRILGIRSIISFHGETVAELRAEFEHAVKDYLAECKKAGVHPEKPMCEGTPLNLVVFFLGLPFGVVLYSLVAYAILLARGRPQT